MIRRRDGGAIERSGTFHDVREMDRRDNAESLGCGRTADDRAIRKRGDRRLPGLKSLRLASQGEGRGSSIPTKISRESNRKVSGSLAFVGRMLDFSGDLFSLYDTLRRSCFPGGIVKPGKNRR